MSKDQLPEKNILDIYGSGKRIAIIIAIALWVFAGFAVVQYYMDKNGPDAPDFMLAIAGGLIFVGLLLMLWNSGLSMDKGEGAIKKWWGFQAPLTKARVVLGSKSYSMDLFTNVKISKEVRRSSSSTSTGSGSSSYTVYPVRIKGSADSLLVQEPRNYKKARKQAETIAKFLNVDMVDKSTGKAIVRKAGTLDESIRDRARRTEEHVELPFTPSMMKTRIEPQGSGVLMLDIPARGLSVAHWIGIGLAIAFAGAVGVFADFGGYILLILPVVILSAVLKNARHRTCITVSHDRLEVISYGAVFKKITDIPAQKLEELFIQDAKIKEDVLDDILKSVPEKWRSLVKSSITMFSTGAIIARSDAATVKITTHISQDELAYLHALIHSKLTR